MFDVLVASEKILRTNDLPRACRTLFWKTEEIHCKNASEHILSETCMIEAEIGGRKRVMNFSAIRSFSRAIGILDAKGHLKKDSFSYISRDYARRLFLARSKAV